MKTIIDSQKIARRSMLANTASVGGLLALLASVLLPYLRKDLLWPASILTLAGMTVSMVGIYYANRWVKKPRPEVTLDTALKGLSDGCCLYHYPRLTSNHVLLTPSAVIVLETVNLEGVFSYQKGRWRERMSLGRAMRFIVEEHLGDPVKAANASAADLRKRLVELLGAGAEAPVRAVVVFTHPRAVMEVEGTALPVVTPDKLKKQVLDKNARLPKETYEQVQAYLDSLT